ncbi:MAG TPA: biotin/lipoyl-containing protein, partial [Chthoniobacterales bacterium]
MPTYIEMPKLSDTMTEGTLAKWRKKEGDKVEIGDILAEVETDKATMEMEAFDEGVLHKILIQDGGKAPVGGPLAVLLGEGEDASSISDKPAAPAEGKKAAAPSAPATEKKEAVPVPAVTAPDNSRVKASPLAKKIAKERGVGLAGVTGTGPGGRVVAKDV